MLAFTSYAIGRTCIQFHPTTSGNGQYRLHWIVCWLHKCCKQEIILTREIFKSTWCIHKHTLEFIPFTHLGFSTFKKGFSKTCKYITDNGQQFLSGKRLKLTIKQLYHGQNGSLLLRMVQKKWYFCSHEPLIQLWSNWEKLPLYNLTFQHSTCAIGCHLSC